VDDCRPFASARNQVQLVRAVTVFMTRCPSERIPASDLLGPSAQIFERSCRVSSTPKGKGERIVTSTIRKLPAPKVPPFRRRLRISLVQTRSSALPPGNESRGRPTADRDGPRNWYSRTLARAGEHEGCTSSRRFDHRPAHARVAHHYIRVLRDVVGIRWATVRPVGMRVRGGQAAKSIGWSAKLWV